eukprot:544112_1
MGQPLSILTTLFVFNTIANAGCIGEPTDEKFECDTLTEPVACGAVTGCEWIDADLPESLTMVWIADGRLHKLLPPIDAVTEYIGDYVYYEQLSTSEYMKDVYRGVLDLHEFEPQIKKAEKYNVLPEIYLKGKGRFLVTKKEKEGKPIGTLLEYSRPLFKAKAFDQEKVTLDRFTLNDVLSVLYIAWWDALTMNHDRFVICYRGGTNKGNIMLTQNSDGNLVYIPIDQGLATKLTTEWFKWIPLKEADREEYRLPKGYKQIIFSEEGLNEIAESKGWFTSAAEPRASIDWRNMYGKWLKDEEKASEFVTENLVYFPKEVATDEALKAKIIEVIDVVWAVQGADLCSDMSESITKVFKQIDKNEPNVKAMLKKTAMLKPTQRGWKLVEKTILNQIKTCVDWGNEMIDEELWGDKVPKFEEIKEAAAKGILFRDWKESAASSPVDLRKRRSTVTKRRSTVTMKLTRAGSDTDSYLKAVLKAIRMDSEPAASAAGGDGSDVSGVAASAHSNHYIELNHGRSSSYDDRGAVRYAYSHASIHHDPYHRADGSSILENNIDTFWLYAICILVVFCIGVAFGMVICWGCGQKKELEELQDKEIHMYRQVNEDQNCNL